MQNQSNQTNLSKGFFGKGLDAIAKMKNKFTGEIQKQATQEIADLQKYLDFGTKMGIIGDAERVAHETKISILESQISKNKLEGNNTLKSMVGKGKDLFAKAKSIDWKVLFNRSKAASVGLGIATMSFLGNPAIAAKMPSHPVQRDNSVKVENAVSKIIEVKSESDAVELDGTVEPGMTIRVGGRNIKVVGDGKNVNLLDSYRYAKSKLSTPVFKNTQTAPIKFVKLNDLPIISSTDNTRSSNSSTNTPNNIVFPKNKHFVAPSISNPVIESPKEIKSKVIPVTPVVVVDKVPTNLKTVLQIPTIQKPLDQSTTKKEIVTITPIVKQSSVPVVLPLESKTFLEDPFKIILPTKPTNLLDDILKIKPQVKPDLNIPPVLDITEIKPDKPSTSIKPNIPFVKPPAPPRPNFDNYNPVSENKIPTPESTKIQDGSPLTPGAVQDEIKLPVSDAVRELRGLGSKTRLNEAVPVVTPMSVKTKMAELNSTKYTSVPKPDRIDKIEGGYFTDKGFFGQASLEFSWGGAPDGVHTATTPKPAVMPPIANKPNINLK
ncbi:MAG: hypothetical protein H7196_02645 [candidate division SR1 bacterium]|nr:hypothetical protein [candidate division SR1 bacterium]